MSIPNNNRAAIVRSHRVNKDVIRESAENSRVQSICSVSVLTIMPIMAKVDTARFVLFHRVGYHVTLDKQARFRDTSDRPMATGNVDAWAGGGEIMVTYMSQAKPSEMPQFKRITSRHRVRQGLGSARCWICCTSCMIKSWANSNVRPLRPRNATQA